VQSQCKYRLVRLAPWMAVHRCVVDSHARLLP
jgi:hypothetical protein